MGTLSGGRAWPWRAQKRRNEGAMMGGKGGARGASAKTRGDTPPKTCGPSLRAPPRILTPVAKRCFSKLQTGNKVAQERKARPRRRLDPPGRHPSVSGGPAVTPRAGSRAKTCREAGRVVPKWGAPGSPGRTERCYLAGGCVWGGGGGGDLARRVVCGF